MWLCWRILCKSSATEAWDPGALGGKPCTGHGTGGQRAWCHGPVWAFYGQDGKYLLKRQGLPSVLLARTLLHLYLGKIHASSQVRDIFHHQISVAGGLKTSLDPRRGFQQFMEGRKLLSCLHGSQETCEGSKPLTVSGAFRGLWWHGQDPTAGQTFDLHPRSCPFFSPSCSSNIFLWVESCRGFVWKWEWSPAKRSESTWEC